jgi:hypothetical protein
MYSGSSRFCLSEPLPLQVGPMQGNEQVPHLHKIDGADDDPKQVWYEQLGGFASTMARMVFHGKPWTKLGKLIHNGNI